MISIQAKKHDDFSVEFRFGFNIKDKGTREDFSANAWIFVPNSLDINPENYGKKQFYRDIKSNVRLITPVYLMRDIASESSLPLTSLKKALEKVVISPSQSDINAYQYHLKMFAAIFKSALRDQVAHILDSKSIESAEYMVDDYVKSTMTVLSRFRSLYRIIDVPTVSENIRSYFKFCDEFMSYMVVKRTILLIKKIDSSAHSSKGAHFREAFLNMVIEERKYKISKGYGILTEDDEHNKNLVYHRGMLKKFIESELYIRLDKKKDGIAVEQLYYSIAAGVAMIFATAVAWHIQVKYGNITWPLFLALVVSYMLKDRIKDLLRYYFAHRLNNKYYDKKASVTIEDKKVGTIKEGFDFISQAKTPDEVLRLRDKSSSVEHESQIFEEKILLYRKRVTINDAVLDGNDDYPTLGINEIMRLHLTRFTHKMDNASVPVDSIDKDGNIITRNAMKIYNINIVFQLRRGDKIKYHTFRIEMTREGVVNIEEIAG